MKTKLRICLFMLLLFVSYLSAYSGGIGTSEDPYQISNLNDLQELSTTSADWGMYFEQTAIIDASTTSGWGGGTGFSPIGNYNTSFTGSYNGNSHAITNMYIYRTNENQPQGLFGYTENATLISINNELVDITGFHGVGAIVGYAYLTNISFCYSSGNVSGEDQIGGIAGENMDGMIEHCTSDCNVTATSSASDRVGGLVGYNLYGSAVIIDSKSTGNVNGYSYTGGLVGDNWGGQINSSKSTSSVTGTNYVGGFIGYTKNASNIKNSYCRGDVIRRSSSTETNIGGYCGYNENSTIEFSYSTGSVYYNGTGAPTDKGFVGDDNGSADVVYSANFYDSQASNQTTGTGATASNTTAMTDATLYANAGWDGTIWFIDASNNGYVHLEFEDWGGQSITWGVAEVSTNEISNIGTNTAQSGGNVTSEGNSSVTSKGVVWDVTDNPTILSYLGITNDGSGSGSFTSTLTGLSPGTLYYVRAYATNSEGTGYGTVKSFTTDIDPPSPMTPPGNALEFDGTDDYVSLPHESNFDFTGSMTVEVWLKVDAFDKDWQAIVTKGDGAWRLHRYSSTNHIAFGTSGLSNVDLEGTTDVNDGKWHHVAGVFDGSTKYLYVDGTLDASAIVTGSITTNNYLVNIAENAESRGRYFDGLIDEVRIWDIARTQTQIQDNMNTVLAGNESGLVAYYKFDQSESPYLWDYTGNDNLGTLYNMDNADWIASCVPMPTDLKLIRNGTLSQTSGGLTMEASSISGSYFVAFGHNNEDLGNLEDCSVEGYNQQLSRFWFVETYGVTTPILSFVIEGTPSSSTPSDYGLLISASSDFSSPSEVMTATTVNIGTKTITFEMSGKAALADGYYTLGSKGGASLPIILSTFTAQFIENTPTIHWSTQSETDNMVWFIYRSDENDFLSPDMISDMIEGHGTTTQQQFYTYEDQIEDPQVGDTYYYWLESIDYGGIINHYDNVAILTIPDTHNSGNSGVIFPERFGLLQNEPNPVINSTRIAFNLHETARVDLAIYNLKGQLVKKLYSGITSKHTVMWNGKDEQGKSLENGVYLYRLLLNGRTEETKKLILMK